MARAAVLVAFATALVAVSSRSVKFSEIFARLPPTGTVLCARS